MKAGDILVTFILYRPVVSKYSIRTALSVSADVSPCGLIRPAAILRQMDSALWLHPTLPSLLFLSSGSHDGFCVSQSLAITALRPEQFPLQRVSGVRKLDEVSLRNLWAHVWLADVGSSSLTFGTLIEGTCRNGLPSPLAVASRKFVRVDAGVPSKWTPSERALLDAALADGPGKAALKALSSWDGTVLDAGPARSFEDANLSCLLPNTGRLLGSTMEMLSNLLRVCSTRVLPRHLNAANHVDHAALVEMAEDARTLIPRNDTCRVGSISASVPKSASRSKESRVLRVNYLAASHLGDEIEAFCAPDGKLVVLRVSSKNRNCSEKIDVCAVEFSI